MITNRLDIKFVMCNPAYPVRPLRAKDEIASRFIGQHAIHNKYYNDAWRIGTQK
ncbi:hypothetical protein Geoth_3454 [Parageobacillus thermoglucosidasius C56-YS93]|nr:hypothetical protein Geoth_3454 [Parageobacillus thermoglucosidasius C56-YS93]